MINTLGCFIPFRHINIWGMHQQVNYKTMGSDNLITNKERATGFFKNLKWKYLKVGIDFYLPIVMLQLLPYNNYRLL